MRLDIYRRAEYDGHYSYLAVPASTEIPGEATNTDWLVEATAIDVPDDAQQLASYDILRLPTQLQEKGYAMTGLH